MSELYYEPGDNLVEERVGKLLVIGNLSCATVCKPGLIRQAIHECDNQRDGTDTPNAFERAKKWASENQDKTGSESGLSFF
jgi:hypothetical protein